jgi:hypothetical protein
MPELLMWTSNPIFGIAFTYVHAVDILRFTWTFDTVVRVHPPGLCPGG